MNKKASLGILLAVAGALIATAIGINVNLQLQGNGKGFTAEIQFSEEKVPAAIQDDRGEVVETTEYNGETIPTVEEVDGGKFEDKDSGMSVVDGIYEDLGWSETYNITSPEAFRDDTLGKCIIANNRYGAQCVSLARVFWWSYADRDVSTCGTGMAKGMMNCADENAGDDFIVYWAEDKLQIQAGDWLVFDGGQFGHVGMALGPVVNGYVALLGENQGGHSCGEGVGGAATNIININTKNLIGFYRPKDYVKPEPEPEPEPEPVVNTCLVRQVNKGDTMGAIMKECTGEIKWGKSMEAYANDWISEKTGRTVFFGWTHGTGYGLLAGDTIKWSGE